MCGVVLQSSGCGQNDPKLEWELETDLGTKPQVSNDARNAAVSVIKLFLFNTFYFQNDINKT